MKSLFSNTRLSCVTPLDAWFLFIKAQVSAFLGGLCDYTIMIIATQCFGLFFSYSIILSGSVGAIVNFTINRYWVFNQVNINKYTQLRKFAVVAMVSILLKSCGTYLLVKFTGFDYKLSRLCVDVITTFGFNFTLQKYWVFSPVVSGKSAAKHQRVS